MISADSSNPASPDNLQVINMGCTDDARWDEFVSHHPDGVVYHHSSWLAALEREYGQKCVRLACQDRDGHLRAILPLFYTKGLPLRTGRVSTGRRLSSLPRTPVAGPLAANAGGMQALLQHAVELVRLDRGLQLEIKTPILGLTNLVPDLACIPWRLTYAEQLPSSIEGHNWTEFSEQIRVPRECGPCSECRKLRFGNAKRQHRVNWAVNKAAKLGLQVREATTDAELAEWYQLYLKTMQHNAIPPRPSRFFTEMWSKLRPLGQFHLFLAEQKNDSTTRMVAGSVLLSFGQAVFYAFTGCSHHDFCLHPHDILQLESIRYACHKGFRWYDFGEVAEDHGSLAQFKTKWGTETRPLFRYYYPPFPQTSESVSSAVTTSCRKLWRFLPLSATAALGDHIYRYL